MHKKLPNQGFTWSVRVYYEDTDSGGVVYHANYLHFMERARTEWLRTLGFEQDQLREQEDCLFAVRRLQIDYLKPARFNDLLSVSLTVDEIGKASFQVAQAICRDLDGLRLCQAQVQVACIDQQFRPRRVPPVVLTQILDKARHDYV